ncbi:6,7-dimethyl-8-ribityllumazine synthase [Pararcticibacter amylolyticus]|uniref:6,7-dimethyl-8-ribityllumazine synthase n=1 Tax=Pararcticibacter amylolyticus TaxID=2173175 RepID=A0A2U2PDF1_9SPHI|nr:6,7-dimethyl-8-ribityllumazine synthase [Pararcticibacter amylolyticus]PWG79431.1 6,7-dimethyl-8-ribityllumazine synthase [Pararcticibacter amylolyticus]
MATHLKNLSDFSHTTIPSASPYHFAIVTAHWNAEITGALYEGAYQFLIKQGADPDHILSLTVPGSFELSSGADMVLQHKKVDAVICLGCVIKGDTPHFDYICSAVAHGVTNVGIKHSIPAIFGVLTTDNELQAKERAGGRHGNKGEEAAATAILMASLKSQLQ